MINPWFKTAIIYTFEVKVFHDSDGDSIGDFRGLIIEDEWIWQWNAERAPQTQNMSWYCTMSLKNKSSFWKCLSRR